MKVALRLVNRNSMVLIDKLKKGTDIDIVYIVDRDEKKWGLNDSILGVPIISPYTFLDYYFSGEIDKLVISPYCVGGANVVMDVVKEMLDMGLPDMAFSVPSVPDIEESDALSDEFLSKNGLKEFRTLPRVQFHIADNCNLNCTACTHFSSLVNGSVFISEDEIERDLMSLKRLVKHIDQIDILGGEPFLNKNWKNYVKIAKKIYKYSAITIITNGLMTWTLNDEDWAFIKENDVCYRMSLYKPMWKRSDELAAFLRNKGVKYALNVRSISTFSITFRKRGTDKNKNRADCPMDCLQIYHGKMSPCSLMMYVKYFNEYWGTNYSEEVAVESLDKVSSFDELLQQLDRPVDICEYCNVQLRSQVFTDWSVMNPGGKACNDISNWIYSE